jgi:hypothetical protein
MRELAANEQALEAWANRQSGAIHEMGGSRGGGSNRSEPGAEPKGRSCIRLCVGWRGLWEVRGHVICENGRASEGMPTGLKLVVVAVGWCCYWGQWADVCVIRMLAEIVGTASLDKKNHDRHSTDKRDTREH